MALVLGRNADVQRAAGGAANNFHRLFRVAASRHRPEHVEFARRIDVFVHDHNEPPVVSAAKRLRGEEKSLARVARIGLLDRNDIKQTDDAGFERPDDFEVGQAGFLDRDGKYTRRYHYLCTW